MFWNLSCTNCPHFVARSKNSYLAQDNSGIVSEQSKNGDKVRIIQYGDQLLNILFLFFFLNRSNNIYRLFSKRISVSDDRSI